MLCNDLDDNGFQIDLQQKSTAVGQVIAWLLCKCRGVTIVYGLCNYLGNKAIRA